MYRYIDKRFANILAYPAFSYEKTLLLRVFLRGLRPTILKETTKAHMIMALQTLIIGPGYTFVSWATAEVDPFTLLYMRVVCSAAVFGGVFWARGGFRGVVPTRRDWLAFWLMALVGIVCNQFFFIGGLTYTTPTYSALIYALTPLAVLFMSALLFGNERLNFRKSLGILAALAGVSMVVYSSFNGAKTGRNVPLGNGLTAAALMCWSFYLSFSRKYMQRFDPLQLTCVLMVLGTILYLPAGVWLLPDFQPELITPKGWFGFGYLVAINSVASYFMIMFAISRLPSSKVAIYMNAQPITATAFSVLYGGETLTALVAAGGLVTLVGILILNLNRN